MQTRTRIQIKAKETMPMVLTNVDSSQVAAEITYNLHQSNSNKVTDKNYLLNTFQHDTLNISQNPNVKTNSIS